MIPLLIAGGLTGLAYLFVHTIGQIQGGTRTRTTTATTESSAITNLRRLALGFLKYINGGGTAESRISAYQRAIGAPITGNPDNASERRIQEILGYNVSWRPKKKTVQPRIYRSSSQSTMKPPIKARTSIQPRARPSTAMTKREKGPLAEIVRSLVSAKKSRASRARKPSSSATTQTETAPAEMRRTPTEAAKELKVYLSKTKNFGTKNNRDPVVKTAQSDMGLTADGIVGPATRARAKELGVILPLRV